MEDENELIERLDYQAKSKHAKNAVFYFFIFGITLFLLSDRKFFSLRTAVFFFVGMWLASLLSIPSFLIKMAIARRITDDQVRKLGCVYGLLELAYDFAVTYFLFQIFTRIL